MGLYDRDYMKERSGRSYSPRRNENVKIIIIAVVSFILGFVVGKII
ncbi:hypothetical protein [Persephonella sp.]